MLTLILGFFSTYYIVTRSVLLVSSLITFVVLVYKGKFHEIDEPFQCAALFYIFLMLLPEVGEAFALLLSLLVLCYLFYVAISAANKVSETRKLTIRAESTKDMPSSGQVSLAATQDGQLTLVEKMEINERELQRIRDRLGVRPTPSDIISSLLQ